MPEKSKRGLSPIRKSCRSKVKMKKLYKKKVLKMLAVMESQQPSSSSKNTTSTTTVLTPEGKAQENEFLQTGRTGRRNALPDILSDHAIVTSSDLPGKFQKLSTNDANEQKDQPGPSSTCL